MIKGMVQQLGSVATSSPTGSKNGVLRFQSVNNIVIAPANINK